MSAPKARTSTAQSRSRGNENLPAVLRPGTHTTPDGVVEISTAAFADSVLARIPDAALLFRMGDVVGRLEGDAGARTFVPLDVDQARLLTDRCVRITGSSKDEATGDIHVAYHPCTGDLARLVLAGARTSSSVRSLEVTTNHPVYLPGLVLARPGYNAVERVFYDEPESLRGIAPLAKGAMEVLDDVLEGFRFKGEADRENALALMVTLVVRTAIGGNVPGFLIRANRERTGKTLLARTACVAIRGAEPPLLQFGATEEEREKRITSELLRGRTFAVFDNLPAGESVDSAALAMLLTAPTWTGRILGKSQTPTLPNGLTLVTTGNNLGASGEIAQREVPIHLESRTADPQAETGFPHEDPVAYALERRRMVLSAILGLVERFKESGRKPFLGVPFGGFEAWTRTVGGILAAAGSVNFLGNLRAWQDSADEFGADIATLLGDWYREALAASGESFSDAVAAKALYQRADRLGLFARHRQGISESARAISFALRVLTVIADRVVRATVVVGGAESQVDLVLRRATSGSNSVYRLELVGPAAAAGAPGSSDGR